jgi:outer membrane protein
MRKYSGVLVLCLVCAPSLVDAQRVVPERLSLEQALEIALGNNPTFLQTRNNRAEADWGVRQAYGALLPSASASGGMSWQGAGEQQFGSLTLGDLGFANQPSYYFSNYSLSLNYSLDWATLKGPGQAKADRAATVAQIRMAEADLLSQVTAAYLEILRQQEALRIAEQQLENSRFNLRLAEGQLAVGAVTRIDVGQAEVQVGRSNVTVLQTRNAFSTARMRLLQQLGLPVTQDFELTTVFLLSQPTWEFADLTEMAVAQNPTLLARMRSRESSEIGVSSAKSAYWPSLSISTGWSGFTREASSSAFSVAQAEQQVASRIASCVSTNDLYSRLANPLPALNCNSFVLTDAQRRSIISRNDQFPFNFQGSPPGVALQVTVPIFQGLSRQRNLEAARLQRDDLIQQVREQEIALEADLSIGLANVRTAYQSAILEEQNRDLAEQQVTLAREQYQIGQITFVELTEQQTVLAEAEGNRIQAVFAYHDAVTTLEALVGAPLRN